MTVDSDNPGAVYNADHTSEINLVGRVVFNTWRILRYRGVFRWGGGVFTEKDTWVYSIRGAGLRQYSGERCGKRYREVYYVFLKVKGNLTNN